MPSYDQTPGTLNLSFVRGNTVSTLVDFSIVMTGYTVTSHVYSLVTSQKVSDIDTTVIDAAAGRVNISFSESTPPVGSYGWSMQWVAPGDAKRTVLTGICEVVK